MDHPDNQPGSTTAGTSTITLAGGCFWCTEAVFDRVRGVTAVQSGYSNGHAQNPTYEQVCTGHTGHAEVVRLQFDETVISLREILEIFFATHDPSQLNRQGNDVGTQYRSGIYYDTEAQGELARQMIKEMAEEGVYDAPITTEVAPLSNWSAAEAYHDDYYARNPNQGYCAAVVGPKVAKFRKTFVQFLKDG
ncbi:peptide-methionine (S)-S-oxide reductase MsrA [Simplicispira suum]|uniref:Peptide methionine sulfoxide reductase MsrA n=1 Tax=Simplicispira suum TaxID=2109915 RepID=A0A2S0N3P0_9BURK|nr:peptide-methionine (S)-S-oxide reductase MsrA [Simplicispira suum]AVO42760.1 peptide-methionine (S)-S-oxide reductase [Simplicispira suum]MBW7833030.1 peptide-methionine (S)-S-oxide reductase MsrA [Simplicispira suum]